jgi:hypothetical protein
MSNPFDAFPPYLKVRDVMDATQYCRASVYQLVKEAEKTPGIVYRRGERGIRIHRDNFFKWYMERSGITPPPELQHA